MKIEGRLWGKWQKKRGKEIKVSSRGEKKLCLFCVCLYIKGRRCHTEVSVCTNIKCYKKVKETIGCWVFATDPGFLFIWLDSSRHIFCELFIFFSLPAELAAGTWKIYIYILPVFLSSTFWFKISFYKEVFLTFQLIFSQLLKTSFILPLSPKLPRVHPSCGDVVSRIFLEIFHMRHTWMFILLFYIICRLVTNAVSYWFLQFSGAPNSTWHIVASDSSVSWNERVSHP